MRLFGFELVGRIEQQTGFPLARILLGNSIETVAIDTSIWSVDDYVRHWQETSGHLSTSSGGVYHLFSSSLSPSDSIVWPAVRVGDNVVISNMIVKMSDLHLDGVKITPSEEFSSFLRSPDSQGSSWEIPVKHVRRFAMS